MYLHTLNFLLSSHCLNYYEYDIKVNKLEEIYTYVHSVNKIIKNYSGSPSHFISLDELEKTFEYFESINSNLESYCDVLIPVAKQDNYVW